MPVRNRLLEIRLQLQAQEGKKITQKDMAERLGFKKTRYNQWELNRGDAQPGLENAIIIAQKLNMTVEEIFYLDPSEKS